MQCGRTERRQLHQGLLRRPGKYGADELAAEGQSAARRRAETRSRAATRILYEDLGLAVEHRRVDDLADAIIPQWLETALAQPAGVSAHRESPHPLHLRRRRRKAEAFVGQAAESVICSQIGMPARSNAVCTGRVRTRVSSMLWLSIPTRAAPSATSRRPPLGSGKNGRDNRRPAPNAGPSRSSTRTAHPRDVEPVERLGVDSKTDSKGCRTTGREVREGSSDLAQVLAVGEPMGRQST